MKAGMGEKERRAVRWACWVCGIILALAVGQDLGAILFDRTAELHVHGGDLPQQAAGAALALGFLVRAEEDWEAEDAKDEDAA